MDTISAPLEALLDKADRDLHECHRPVGRVVYTAGNTVAWDNCCGSSEVGGQLWVRIISVLPQPQTAQIDDITDLQVRVGLGIVRCQHVLDDDGVPPSVEEMLQDARGQGKDLASLLHSIRHWRHEEFQFKALINWKSIKVESGVPLGPEGGCGGFEWTLVFRIQYCEGCDEA